MYSGESIALMAKHPKAPGVVHGFDSFVGLVRLWCTVRVVFPLSSTACISKRPRPWGSRRRGGFFVFLFFNLIATLITKMMTTTIIIY